WPLAQGAWGCTPPAAPCTPGLWRTKSPLRGALDLSLTATGSAILTPPTPVRFVIKAQEYL
ncbi:hypothetical protein, partial [Escherichia coli]|uniref:hypothetical protein n=1 Tax=Escherichia coli TaxID=562 RepID=UPI001BB47FB3